MDIINLFSKKIEMFDKALSQECNKKVNNRLVITNLFYLAEDFFHFRDKFIFSKFL